MYITANTDVFDIDFHTKISSPDTFSRLRFLVQELRPKNEELFTMSLNKNFVRTLFAKSRFCSNNKIDELIPLLLHIDEYFSFSSTTVKFKV